jgi:hypothetical protein
MGVTDGFLYPLTGCFPHRFAGIGLHHGTACYLVSFFKKGLLIHTDVSMRDRRIYLENQLTA